MKLLDRRAIEALAKYKSEGLVKPGDKLFWKLARRYQQEAADEQQDAD